MELSRRSTDSQRHPGLITPERLSEKGLRPPSAPSASVMALRGRGSQGLGGRTALPHPNRAPWAVAHCCARYRPVGRQGSKGLLGHRSEH